MYHHRIYYLLQEAVEDLVREVLKELGLYLSDEYIDRIVELILKLMSSGIDMSGLAGNGRDNDRPGDRRCPD